MIQNKNKPKILVADDEDALRLLARETLDSGEMEIIEALDGVEALEIALRDHPVIILLDVAMPGLTGFDVCEQLKSNPVTADIVIVMLTAHGQSTDRERAAMVGADHFMIKPFSPVQLLRLVGQIL